MVGKRLLRQIGRLNRAYGLIGPGHRVMVAVSGGKDSWSLLDLLRRYRRVVPFDFELVAFTLDQGQPGFEPERLRAYYEKEGYAHQIAYQDTYSVVLEKLPAGATQCSLCARLRRGHLYRAALALGADRVALGHHRDDIVETLLLNLFYSGQLKAMPPKLISDDGQNVLIRPLAWCAEADIAAYAVQREFPIVPCDLCGSQRDLKRQEIKALLGRLSADNPRLKGNMMAALANVHPSHLFDRRLLDQDAS